MARSLQGTTSNGEYLLPFKTGAFLAGEPVQPVILKYGKVLTASHVLPRQADHEDQEDIAMLSEGVHVHSRATHVQGRISPAWESISAPQHLFLLLANIFHSLTAYEVCDPVSGAS